MAPELGYLPLQGKVLMDNAYQTAAPSLEIRQWVSYFWQLNVPIGKFHYRSIPDNCVDWIINVACPEENFLVTPFCSPTLFELEGPVSYFGIRFSILGQLGFIPVPLGEWNDNKTTVDSSELIPADLFHPLLDNVAKTTSFNERCVKVTSLLEKLVNPTDIDPRLKAYSKYCFENTGSNIDLSDQVCAQFGISARQLRRLSQLHLGLTPKNFSRVIRFQQSLKQIQLTDSRAVWTDHYYDQAHFIHEFKTLSGLTPTELNKLSVLYNNFQGK